MAVNTVILKCNSLGERYDEKTAGGAITPGHLLKENSDGTVVVHPTADAYTPLLFALEERLQGKMVDDAYASSDKVLCFRPQPGDELYVLLKQGYNVVNKTLLSSNGDGTFKKSSASTSYALLEAIETVSNSGGSAPVRVRARVLETWGPAGAGSATTTTTTTT